MSAKLLDEKIADRINEPATAEAQQKQTILANKQTIAAATRSVYQPPAKDNWDKLAAIAPIVSGTLIFAMGGFFTYTFNQQQLKLQEIQTIEKFIPHLMGNEQSKKAAILAIKNLTNAELATKFAAIFASSGTVSALQNISENGTAHEKSMADDALADAMKSLKEKESKLNDLEKSYQNALVKSKIAGTNGANGAYLYNMSKLADTYRMTGQYLLAEPLLKKTLAMKEKVYGSENPQVADTLRDLAQLYQMDGNAAEAGRCIKRAEAIEAKYKFAQTVEGNSDQLPTESSWNADERASSSSSSSESAKSPATSTEPKPQSEAKNNSAEDKKVRYEEAPTQ